jgi:hypothetical protein
MVAAVPEAWTAPELPGYPGWSEGKLNAAFMDLAKEFFSARGDG